MSLLAIPGEKIWGQLKAARRKRVGAESQRRPDQSHEDSFQKNLFHLSAFGHELAERRSLLSPHSNRERAGARDSQSDGDRYCPAGWSGASGWTCAEGGPGLICA